MLKSREKNILRKINRLLLPKSVEEYNGKLQFEFPGAQAAMVPAKLREAYPLTFGLTGIKAVVMTPEGIPTFKALINYVRERGYKLNLVTEDAELQVRAEQEKVVGLEALSQEYDLHRTLFLTPTFWKELPNDRDEQDLAVRSVIRHELIHLYQARAGYSGKYPFISEGFAEFTSAQSLIQEGLTHYEVNWSDAPAHLKNVYFPMLRIGFGLLYQRCEESGQPLADLFREPTYRNLNEMVAEQFITDLGIERKMDLRGNIFGRLGRRMRKRPQSL